MAGRSFRGPSRLGGRIAPGMHRPAGLLAAAAILIAVTMGMAREARAFHPFRHGGAGFGHCGVAPIGWGGWCGPRFAPPCGFGGFGPAPGWCVGGPGFGWGGCWPAFGSVSYGAGFAFGGTRFWSGSTILGVPFWGGGFGACAPVWGGPVWGAPVFAGSFCGGPAVWGGGCCGPAFGGPVWGFPAWQSPVSAWYGGWMAGPARGWNLGPARGWNVPFAAAPPRGAPFADPFPVGRGRHPVVAGRQPGPAPLLVAEAVPAPRGGRGGVGVPAIDAAVEREIRTSNAPSRARAARLVKAGDRHLRDAVDDPTRLAKAIDAYRRAAAIAADQPDIFLRQAIALTASGKREAAAAALSRAVAIDGRLADAVGGPAVGLPLDVRRVATALDVRSGKLVERIFAERGATADANWIAKRWADRDAPPVLVAARE